MGPKIISGYPFVPYHCKTYWEDQMLQRSNEFYQRLDQGRTVCQFSEKPVNN